MKTNSQIQMKKILFAFACIIFVAEIFLLIFAHTSPQKIGSIFTMLAMILVMISTGLDLYKIRKGS
jgi:NADH:ubiquinone oxidoreductase subunit 3 (subunit A)